jgi:DNA-binding CsgD family transcriptional regulator
MRHEILPLTGTTFNRLLPFSDTEWQALMTSLGPSGREKQIAECVFAQQKEAAIAARLHMSPHTVPTHFERLYRKLGVENRCGLVIRVLQSYVDLLRSPQHSGISDAVVTNATCRLCS